MAIRRRNTPTARTSSPSAAPPSIRRAPGTFRSSASRPISNSTPSPRRCPRARRNATSAITRISPWASIRNRPMYEAAKTFLAWLASPEFATLYANALPGFFSLSSAKVEVKDPVAKTFVGWRETCESDDPQFLPDPLPRHAQSRERAVECAPQVINGTMTPSDGAKKLEDGLASWYPPPSKPQQASHHAPVSPCRTSSADEQAARRLDAAHPCRADPGVPGAGGPHLHALLDLSAARHHPLSPSTARTRPAIAHFAASHNFIDLLTHPVWSDQFRNALLQQPDLLRHPYDGAEHHRHCAGRPC